MTTKESLTLKASAEKLYVKGETVAAIRKKLGVGKRTLQLWRTTYDWDESRIEVIDKIREDMKIDVAEEKENTFAIIKAAEEKYAEYLLSDEEPGLPKCTSSFAQLQKLKWDLLIPKEPTQFNFMKQENNTNISVNLPELLRSIRNGEGM